MTETLDGKTGTETLDTDTALVAYWQDAHASEGKSYALEADAALKACRYRRFVSRSKGRRYYVLPSGERKFEVIPRKHHKDVRLLTYNGKTIDLDGDEKRVDERLDTIAHELLSEVIDAEAHHLKLSDELLRRLETHLETHKR